MYGLMKFWVWQWNTWVSDRLGSLKYVEFTDCLLKETLLVWHQAEHLSPFYVYQRVLFQDKAFSGALGENWKRDGGSHNSCFLPCSILMLWSYILDILHGESMCFRMWCITHRVLKDFTYAELLSASLLSMLSSE